MSSWPLLKELSESLGEKSVRLRVTLSCFVEPNAGTAIVTLTSRRRFRLDLQVLALTLSTPLPLGVENAIGSPARRGLASH